MITFEMLKAARDGLDNANIPKDKIMTCLYCGHTYVSLGHGCEHMQELLRGLGV